MFYDKLSLFVSIYFTLYCTVPQENAIFHLLIHNFKLLETRQTKKLCGDLLSLPWEESNPFYKSELIVVTVWYSSKSLGLCYMTLEYSIFLNTKSAVLIFYEYFLL